MIDQETQILEKWMNAKGKLSVASIADPYLRRNAAILLENLSKKENYIAESAPNLYEADITTTNYGSNAGDGARFQPIAMALLRRTYTDYFAHKCVGFQTMQGPVGLVYALRKVYDIPGVPGSSSYLGGSDAYEAGFRALNEYSGYTGSSAGSALSTATSAIYDFSNSATAGRFGTGATTSAAELWKIGSTMPQLRLFHDKKAVEAKTRKLAASFSLETAQDLRSMHNIDVEREMLEVLAREIPAERDREVIGRMMQAALNPTLGGAAAITFDVSGTDGRWSQEKIANLINAVVKIAGDIATYTMVGAANFCICSPRVAAAFAAAGGQFTSYSSDVNIATTVSEVGKINGTITVYRDALAPTDYCLLGYKGPSTQDTGIVVCDYITMLTNKAIRPDDFGVNIGCLSRYDIIDSLLGSGRYYRVIKVNNLDRVMGV